MTYAELLELAQEVSDEQSFIRFLKALREDCEKNSDCGHRRYGHCDENCWETRKTRDYFKSMEHWAGGDFAEGRHYGDPMLRRVATMMLVGRHYLSDERPDRDDPPR